MNNIVNFIRQIEITLFIVLRAYIPGIQLYFRKKSICSNMGFAICQSVYD